MTPTITLSTTVTVTITVIAMLMVSLVVIQESLLEVEEKYRKAMVSNAQLHNDKSTLMYQVETLKDELSDVEELLWEARRRRDDISKVRLAGHVKVSAAGSWVMFTCGVFQEFEREHQAHRLLQLHFKEAQETLRRSEELLTVSSRSR